MAIIEKTKTITDARTLAPAGMTITRNGMKFIVSWKIIDRDYGAGQQLQWRTNTTKDGVWYTETIPTYATSSFIVIDPANFFPNVSGKYFTKLYVRVRGMRSQTVEVTSKQSGSDTIRTTTTTTYKWSAWCSKNYDVLKPLSPSITATLDDTLATRTTFAWETETSSSDHHPVTNVQYQTMLVRACTESDGSKLSWSSGRLGWGEGYGSTTDSITRTEESTLLANDSYTRWVRIRSRGPAGASGTIANPKTWKYARHVYARPYTAVIKSASATSASTNLKTVVSMKWVLKTGAAHPVDRVEAQWYIGQPDANLAVPAGVSWEVGATIADTADTDAVRFTVDDVPGTDECMWVRVVAYHDTDENFSESTPKRIAVGSLADPSGLTVTNAVMSAGTATVSAINNSDVPDSQLAVVCRRKGARDIVCGVIAHGETSVDVTVDPWTTGKPVSFGVYAFQGTYKSHAVAANMTSDTIWDGGAVPLPPTYTTATMDDGEIVVEWVYSWADATAAEVSWSTDKNAWESTNEPDTYIIDRTRGGKLRISGLEMGNVYYVRVRQISTDEDGTVYGPYCSIKRVDLSIAPGKPLLALSAYLIRPGRKSIAARWEFDAPDGTRQAYAEICNATVSGETVTYGTILAKTESATKSMTVNTEKWTNGTTRYLCVRVTGRNGLQSEWSDPVAVSVADPLTVTFSQWSLSTETITDPDSTTRTVLALTEMPMTVTVTGAGAGGTTTLAIERAEAYQMDRPDEDVFHGFDGETVYTLTQTGEGQFTIDNDDLIGHLDDGADYRLVATIQDGLGQIKTRRQKFTVLWSHQAVTPTATVVMDNTHLVARIRPVAPTGTESGDVADIYRLSADKPQLVVRDGRFGTNYVDPYPTIGEFGGYRVVFRTANNDYITAGNQPAWTDYPLPLNIKNAIIDFDGDRVFLDSNLDVTNAWQKDFTETKYLGGSVQGDWNPAVSRTGTVSTAYITLNDPDAIQSMRRLADYPGICHVRTPEGSSFAADVQVSETRDHGHGGFVLSYQLTITRVDPDGLDGMTYAEWRNEQEGN